MVGRLVCNGVGGGGVTADGLVRIAPVLTGREWRPGLAVGVGDIYAHEGYIWRCVAAHTTQSDWRPSLVPSLWRKIERAEPDAPRIWQSQTDFVVDAVVHYPDVDSPASRCIQGTTSQDGWDSPTVPALLTMQASMDIRKNAVIPS